MDFDMIEGMSEEEIENMFDIYNNDILDYDGARNAFCLCFLRYYNVLFGDTFFGGCALQLTTDASCQSHCSRKGFVSRDYTYQECWCETTGRYSNWSSCKR